MTRACDVSFSNSPIGVSLPRVHDTQSFPQRQGVAELLFVTDPPKEGLLLVADEGVPLNLPLFLNDEQRILHVDGFKGSHVQEKWGKCFGRGKQREGRVSSRKDKTVLT